jgi:alpha-tubulin suppressor-like RCC1 family protein
MMKVAGTSSKSLYVFLTLYLSLLFNVSCTIHASIHDLASKSTGTPLSKIVNPPDPETGILNLGIQITGSSVDSYIYKVGPSLTTDCQSVTGYSTSKDVSALIADSISSLPDGPMKLCVLGINGNGLQQDPSQATVAEWIKDTVPPVVSVSTTTQFVDDLNKTSFPLSGTCSEEGKAVFISGPLDAEATCTSGVWSKVVDLSSVGDGTVSFQVKQVDTAKNQSLQTLNGVNKDVAPAAEISVQTSAIKVTEGNQSLQFTIKSSLAKLYDIIIPFTVHGDAAFGTDHSLTAGTVTIPAGQTTGSVSFNIQENGNVGTENRMLINIAGQTQKNVIIGGLATQVIDISDNDGGVEKTILDFEATGGSTCIIHMPGNVLKCWGSNTYGELGDGTTTQRVDPTPVNSAQLFKKVVRSGGPSNCGLTTSNQAYCWGWNGGGQLGDGSTTQRTSPSLVGGGMTFKTIDGGGANACGIDSSDKLFCWGYNPNGQIGDGTTSNRSSPVPIDATVTYKAISVGEGVTCGITLIGNSMKCWGQNTYGQIGNGTTTNSLSPVLVDSSIEYQTVSAGLGTVCGITMAGLLRCWGLNSYGQLGDGTTTNKLVPTTIDAATIYTSVEVGGGSNSACGITSSGIVKCWGYNYYGVVGDGTSTDRLTPVAILNGNTFTKVSIGSNHACALSTVNSLICWGSNIYGQTRKYPALYTSTPLAAVTTKTWKHIERSYYTTCGIDSTDKLFCWGKNTAGFIGDGTKIDRGLPVAVLVDKSISKVSVGYESSCAIDSNGKLYCWGQNTFGGVGDGTTINRISPVAVDSETSFSKVSVGAGHACALTLTGQLKCWGKNNNGALGIGTTVNASSPTVVNSGVLYKDIAVGYMYACGITAADKINCWGANTTGQLGDASTTQRLVPTAIDAANSYQSISVGKVFYGTTCGITLAGVLRCWGDNTFGQIGDSSTTQRTSPVTIHSGTSYMKISSGSYSTCGLTVGKKLYCWGENSKGQLGDTTIISRTSPVAVDAANNYQSISNSATNACALRDATGALYCWGGYENGAFGSGLIESFPTNLYRINY